ncbi:hypothetical protein [Sinomonas albida]|uniref:hypothetical protein n=1 Tax=Sinomonas albida TaxID=369942 RepID=UPI0010A75743|nr:hypothetical protein [Sinomonas albida]
MTAVREPTRELRRLATRIDFALKQFLSERGTWDLTTKFEAPRHGWTLSNLALRHSQSTLTLAKTDMVLAPTAWVTARAAVETAARCLWLLQPEDEWEREARWIALLHEGARIKRKETEGFPHIVAQAKAIEDFANAVTAELPDGVSVPKRVDTIQEILAAEGEGLPRFYVMASQYTHAAELGTRSYRTNLGTKAVYGDLVDAKDWLEPLWIAYLSFRVTAMRLIYLKGEDLTEILELADRQVAEARDAFVASLQAKEPV